MKVYIALLHYPVYNKSGKIVTTCITGFDLHDISRTACTYGIKKYFVVNPNKGQRIFAERIIDHWKKEESQVFNPTRVEAFNLLALKENLDGVEEEISQIEGQRPIKIATSAKVKGNISFRKLSEHISHGENPYLILFGTGWGLAKEIIESADYVLEPIAGAADYNHLSVRSAVAIILDRLLGREGCDKIT